MIERGDNARVDPEADPRLLGQHIPSSEQIPSQPKDIRLDANEIAKWTLAHYKNSVSQRQHLERLWIRCESYMDGFHYFTIDATGQWKPVPPKDGEIRSTVPLMRSTYRRELGRFTENILTVQGFPKSPANPNAAYKAQRAEAMINAWQDEVDFADVYEDWISQQLYYGLSGLYRYIDSFKKQVFCEAWPAWELHPIPWTANKDSEVEGVQRVKQMTRDWIEQYVGKEAAAKATRGMAQGPRVGGSPLGNSIGGHWSGDTAETAQIHWVWMLPTPDVPTGQHYLLVEDEMFRFKATVEQGEAPALRNGKIPIEFGRYTRQQNSWYGMGLLPTVFGAQAEADRQWSKVVRSSRLRNGLLMFDDEVLNKTDMFNDDLQVVGFDRASYGASEEFFKFIPPAAMSPDVGASLSISQEMGRMAAGHDSDILFGKAEGRVESGPMGRMLNVNAQAPIAPTLGRIYRGLFNTYQDVLDMVMEVWPEDKRIRTIGQFELATEQMIAKEGRPASEDVILKPSPLLPSGKSEMANMLFQLRSRRSDGGDPEITSDEFRRGLAAINMAPPGLEMIGKQDERIRQRVAELFNDGQTPGQWFSDPVEMKLVSLEDPKAFKEALVDKILDPGFRGSASPKVKEAFLLVLKFVRTQVIGDQPMDGREDENLDLESYDARRSEEFLDAAEQSDQLAGQMSIDGIPVGVQ